MFKKYCKPQACQVAYIMGQNVYTRLPLISSLYGVNFCFYTCTITKAVSLL